MIKYIGKKLPDREYEIRDAVYVILRNKDKIAIVYINNVDMYNLVGGKIEDNEDEITALKRECLEEIGYDIKNIRYFDKVGSYYYLDFKDLYIEAIVTFYIADIGDKICNPIETTHELIWMDLNDAISLLYFAFHKYILEKYLDSKNILKGE
jgi:8-oxo-dGTP diphosphatase